MALRELNIDANKEVTILQIGGTPLRTAALQAGSIDATLLTPEEKVSAERFGIMCFLIFASLDWSSLPTKWSPPELS